MGVVYRAYDTRLRREVALKVLPPEHLADPEYKQRLMREARAASALNYPNIVTVHEIGSEGGVDFIAMELVEGKNLREVIPPKGLPMGKVLDYAAQIAGGLAKAHAAGVVHRDLKPGNIMVTPDGLVKLLDFGLAKVRHGEAVAGMTAPPTETTPLTGEGTFVGTLQYMAPEQLESKEADARTDIFALGAVIYELATGRKAFEGKSHAAVIAAILEREPPTDLHDSGHGTSRAGPGCSDVPRETTGGSLANSA
jgi:serine/threonine protein kinase